MHINWYCIFVLEKIYGIVHALYMYLVTVLDMYPVTFYVNWHRGHVILIILAKRPHSSLWSKFHNHSINTNHCCMLERGWPHQTIKICSNQWRVYWVLALRLWVLYPPNKIPGGCHPTEVDCTVFYLAHMRQARNKDQHNLTFCWVASPHYMSVQGPAW